MEVYKLLQYLAVLVIYSRFDSVDSVKPTNLAREVICEGCHAVIQEANSILGSSKRGSKQVSQAVQNVCQINRLTKYEFSPPNMIKACDYWKDNYIDEVKEVLSAGGDVEDQEIQLCFVETDVCQKVDRSNFRINKYSGPSKRKIKAALNSDEEVVATDEGETGEEVFANEEIDKEIKEDEDDPEEKQDEKSTKKKKDGKKQGKEKNDKDGKKEKKKVKGDKKKKEKGEEKDKSGKKDGKKGDSKNKKTGQKSEKDEL